jgi:membrane-anchored glycerophosphoryl diester phosphodiesterase (GDPDase)
VAFIVCVIWAIRFYCSYQLAVPVCVLEKRSAVDCLKRSRFLSKGKGVQRILLVLFLSGVLTYVLSLALSLPVIILTTVSAADKTAGLAMPIAIWQYLGGFFAGTIAGPIATIALALLYYDERVRKEAFDLQLMMEAMGQQASQAAAAAAAPTVFG